MNPYLKTAIWIVVGIFLITHPSIITQVFHSIAVFAATMKQGGY